MPNTARKLLLGMLGGSAAFSPLTIPSLALWLDASDASTLFQDDAGTTPAVADGAVVGYWGDKSTNARHVTQATAGSKPTLQTAELNGKNVVQFDGADDYLFRNAVNVSQPFTVALVVKVTEGSSRVFLGGGQSSVFAPSFAVSYYANSSTVTGTVTKNSVWFVADVLFSGASSDLYVNNVLAGSGSAGTGSITNLGIGAYATGGTPFTGFIAEVLVYSAALSGPQRSALRTYLGVKWGVAF
jgi:hypothetical protein